MNLRLSLQDVSILCHSCGPSNPLQHINVLLELGMLYSTSRCKSAKYRIESNSSFRNCIVFYAPDHFTNTFAHEVPIGISVVTAQLIIDHVNILLKGIAL